MSFYRNAVLCSSTLLSWSTLGIIKDCTSTYSFLSVERNGVHRRNSAHAHAVSRQTVPNTHAHAHTHTHTHTHMHTHIIWFTQVQHTHLQAEDESNESYDEGTEYHVDDRENPVVIWLYSRLSLIGHLGLLGDYNLQWSVIYTHIIVID